MHQKTAFIQKLEAASCAAFRQYAEQFIAYALGGDPANAVCFFPDSSQSFRLNRKLQSRGEADRTQHAQVVFLESSPRITDRADRAVSKVNSSVHKVQDLLRNRVLHQPIDGEITAARVKRRIGLETDLARMSPVAV